MERHIGRKIEKIRQLRGMTQSELGQLLGVTKQAVSKMEKTERCKEEKLRKVAAALGVTPEGLKSFSEESIFYEHEIGRTIERYEKLLDQMKREEKDTVHKIV
jgi:transcriptional regulator with XRE-family HTH domain